MFMHHANFANNQQDIMAVVESDDAGLSDASDVAEGGDTSDEEGEFEAWIAQLRELETTQEAKADSLADKLRISLERGQQTALGELSGEWTLYSKAYLEEAIKVENYKSDKEKWRQFGHWTCGSVWFDSPHLREPSKPEEDLHGVEIELEGGEMNAWQFMFDSKFASLEPLRANAENAEVEDSLEVHLTLLGEIMLQLAVPALLLPEERQGCGNIRFVGIRQESIPTSDLERDILDIGRDNSDCEKRRAIHNLVENDGDQGSGWRHGSQSPSNVALIRADVAF
jgi:hypothetical protein